MRTMAIATLCLLLVSSRIQAAQPPKREAFGKRAIIKACASASVGQIANTPHEWGRGASGFGKRFGSAMGRQAVNTFVQFGVATLRHEDLKYYRSGKQGFGPRMKYALVSTVVARKTT